MYRIPSNDLPTPASPTHPVVRTLAAALALMLLFATSAPAQSSASVAGHGKGAGPRLDPVTKIEITLTNRAEFERLVGAGYDVAGVWGDRVVVYADKDELAALSSEGWSLKTLPPGPSPLDLGIEGMLGAYNDYSNMTAMLDGYASNYPSICRKLSLGKSVQNRDLWALKITSSPDLPADKPKFKYALGLDPNHFDAGPQLLPTMVYTNNADRLGCRFGRNAGATDLIYRVQAANALPAPTWTDVVAFAHGSGWSGPGEVWELNPSSNSTQVVALDNQPAGAGSNRFMRLWVMRP
jgi:hypothetical protein